MAYTITVNIDQEGNTTFEVKGVRGPGCEKVLRPFERLGKVVEERKTAEYHQAGVGITAQQQ